MFLLYKYGILYIESTDRVRRHTDCVWTLYLQELIEVKLPYIHQIRLICLFAWHPEFATAMAAAFRE